MTWSKHFGFVPSSHLAILALKLCIAVHPSGFGIRQNLCLPLWRQAKCLGPNLWEKPRQAPLADQIQHIAPPETGMVSWIGFRWKGKATAFWRNAGGSIPRSLWSLCFRMPRSQFVWAFLSYPITGHYWNCQFPANRDKAMAKKTRSPSIHVVFSPGFMVMEVMPHGLMGVVKHKIFIHCPRRKRMEALTYCCMMKWMEEWREVLRAAPCIQATLWHKRMPLRRL